MTVAERTARVDSGPRFDLDLVGALTPLLEVTANRNVPTLVSASWPVDDVDPVALHDAAGPLGVSLWLQPSEGVALVGIGEAWAARGQHESRFKAVSKAWSGLLDDAVIDSADAPRGGGPLLLGGFSFSDDPAPAELWQSFEPACLVLPALLLTTTPAGSWLTASIMVEPDVAGAPSLRSLAETWTHLAATSTRPAVSAFETLRVTTQEPEAPAWRDSVARLAGAVGRGRLDKAVLSRQVSLEGGSEIEISAVLRRLQVSAPESTVFAISRGSRTFLGATPERLVSLQGRELSTMAMAGSTRRAADVAADDVLAMELLASDKEREEHAVVVAMLREALGPVTEELSIASKPGVVRLRHVQHLVTPVSGRLREDDDVLTLVGRVPELPKGWI